MLLVFSKSIRKYATLLPTAMFMAIFLLQLNRIIKWSISTESEALRLNSTAVAAASYRPTVRCQRRESDYLLDQ